MEEIEVNIKLAGNNLIYYMPIRKSDTILRLKEYCQKISDIPPAEQNLLYKGKILLNDKLIGDYNIENNQIIYLVKKNETKSVNPPLAQNYDSSNSNKNAFNINNIRFGDIQDINYNEVSQACRQIPDISSLFQNLNAEQMNNYCKEKGLGSFANTFGFEPQVLIDALKDPSFRDLINTIYKDPSLLEMVYKSPENQKVLQKDQLLKFNLLNPQLFFNPTNFQIPQNISEKNERNIIESSRNEITVTPYSNGRLNNNKLMNSSGQITNNNSFNNNNTPNKESFRDNRIDIDYKEKYRDQLSQLNDMGFMDEETNIQALQQCNGNINNALEKLLK